MFLETLFANGSFTVMLFREVANHCCRKSLCKVLQTISDLYELNIKNTYLLRLSNFFSITTAPSIRQNLLKNLVRKF